MQNDRRQTALSAERRRLEAQRAGRENWRLWGPYLAERAWGTVREDYSADGTAWEYFDHDQARSRAYRWNEDGLGGICDEAQRLCFALALWNGKDPILKERTFGLTGNQGNHGEDVKEHYFYLGATPSHSYLHYLYKYPQAEYPYRRLVEENARRSRRDPPFGLLDTGVFADGRYWDVELCYAKAAVDEIHIRIRVTNRGPETATLHVMPTLWFRNTWAWNDGGPKPTLAEVAPPGESSWRVRADHPTLGRYFLHGRHPAQLLFTENESNHERLWGQANPVPYVKDAFHRLLIHGEKEAVNPGKTGTKFAACYRLELAGGDSTTLELTLSREPAAASRKQRESIFARRRAEAAEFYDELLPGASAEEYEWHFDDVNPPVLAMAALKVFRAERVQRGSGDLRFLQRVMHKLLLNYAWWLNRKDADGHNVFEGGFLGLDNISVYDGSKPLPPGYSLKQADATGWIAMFALNMTLVALELTADDTDYEDVAIQCYVQFLGIANTIGGHTGNAPSLWDPVDGFFKDFVVGPDGGAQRIDVFSWVGIIPLFACEIVYPRLPEAAPRFAALLHEHGGGMFDGHTICACPEHTNDRGEHLLALVDATMLPRILEHLLSEDEFLSRYGIRSVSRVHAERRDLGTIAGVGRALIAYEPGESTSALFGGNSNWRGPVWMPTNYCLIQALEKFHRYLGDGYKMAVPCLDNRELTLKEIARFLADRLVDLFRRSGDGRVPALPPDGPFQHDRHWKELLLFHEYFHGDTGLGLGAMHQTGWTALVVNLVERRYRNDIPAYWKRQTHIESRAHDKAAAV